MNNSEVDQLALSELTSEEQELLTNYGTLVSSEYEYAS